MYGSYGTEPQAASTINITATTAGTSILIPSLSSTNLGNFYITDIHLCNGITAGNFTFGTAAGFVAPTGSAIVLGPVYNIASAPFDFQYVLPMKVTGTQNFVVTAVSSTTMAIQIVYYVTT